jgi:hypothetical protein
VSDTSGSKREFGRRSIKPPMDKAGDGDLGFSRDEGEGGGEERNSKLEREDGGGDESGVSLWV